MPSRARTVGESAGSPIPSARPAANPASARHCLTAPSCTSATATPTAAPRSRPSGFSHAMPSRSTSNARASRSNRSWTFAVSFPRSPRWSARLPYLLTRRCRALLAGRGRFAGGLLAICGVASSARLVAYLVPVFFREPDTVVLGGFLDVGERDVAFFVRDRADLIEARDRVPDVRRVGQRLFALLRERVDAVGQVAALGELAVFLVGLPGRSCHTDVLPAASPEKTKRPLTGPVRSTGGKGD